MADFYETLLPSGRAIRIEKLRTKEYREAQLRAGERAGKSSFNFQQDMSHELVLSSLRAITVGPVSLVVDKKSTQPSTEAQKEPETGKQATDIAPLPVFDFDKTLEQIPANSWMPTSYQSLVTKGDTSIYEVLGDPSDYESALLFATQVIGEISPLGRMAMGKKRLTSTT